MKKTIFTDTNFFWGLILIISSLLIWNVYVAVTYANLLSLLPIVIQSILMVLILTKHEHARIGIKIWSVLFLIVAYGMQFAGQLLQDLVNGFADLDFEHYLTTGIAVLIGILIYLFTNRTVEIQRVTQDESND